MDTHTDENLRELSLFSGAGGGLLGSLLLGWRTVCCVEWNEYCQSVLRQRMRDGWLDDAPIWDDVRTFDGRPWRGRVDVLTAGFPCQPFSVAGKQGADKDERNMWPDTARIIREVRPPLALLENVTGLTSGRHGYFGRVLGDLAESGYDAVWDIVPAAAADAPHRRERVWVLARDTHQHSKSEHALNAEVARMRSLSEALRDWPDRPAGVGVADGVADRTHRLKALGNGQVPQQMALAWSLLSRRMLREVG